MTQTTLPASVSVSEVISAVDQPAVAGRAAAVAREHQRRQPSTRPTATNAMPSRVENWLATHPKIATSADTAMTDCVYVGPRRCPVRRAMPSRRRRAHRAAERAAGEEARLMAEEGGDLRRRCARSAGFSTSVEPQ